MLDHTIAKMPKWFMNLWKNRMTKWNFCTQLQHQATVSQIYTRVRTSESGCYKMVLPSVKCCINFHVIRSSHMCCWFYCHRIGFSGNTTLHGKFTLVNAAEIIHFRWYYWIAISVYLTTFFGISFIYFSCDGAIFPRDSWAKNRGHFDYRKTMAKMTLKTHRYEQ